MSRDELKPGDICLIIGARRVMSNIGKTGKLVQLVHPGDTLKAPDGRTIVYGSDEAAWLVRGAPLCSITFGGRVCEGFALCDAHHLMKLKGDKEQPRELATDRVREAEGVLL